CRTAQPFDCLTEGQSQERFVIDVGDDVVRLYSSLGSWRIVDRCHDLEPAVLHRELEADAAELSECWRSKTPRRDQNSGSQLCKDIEPKPHGIFSNARPSDSSLDL